MSSNIQAEHLQIGEGTVIHPSAVIRGIHGAAKRIVIGDHVYIGESVQIIIDDIEIGDYSKIHHHTNIHGYEPCRIGHNAWIGQYTIIDSVGGAIIGNNCGIGAHSQLWSHIKFGDTLEGCRFLDARPLSVGNDVWFVGHCIVSPITAADRSMALVGSVVTRNMEENCIYAGSPAKNVSDKVGQQFAPVSLDEKMSRMSQYLAESGIDVSAVAIVERQPPSSAELDAAVSYFFVADRTYTKRRHPAEVALMKFLLPEKAKFVPVSW